MFSDKKFESYVVVNSENGCWEWNGWRNKLEYGKVKRRKIFGSVEVLAHRYSWYLTYGFMPELCVCHKCDNPKCVNPNHLFLGTHLDNILDKVKKGRAKGGSFNQIGEKNKNAKLSNKETEEIKDLIKYGFNNTEIGNWYGVTHSNISLIRRKKMN